MVSSGSETLVRHAVESEKLGIEIKKDRQIAFFDAKMIRVLNIICIFAPTKAKHNINP